MNEHFNRIQLITQLIQMVDDTFDELKNNLMNKKIKCKVYMNDGDYFDMREVEVTGIVTNITLYEYDLTITVKIDEGREYYVCNQHIEVVE